MCVCLCVCTHTCMYTAVIKIYQFHRFYQLLAQDFVSLNFVSLQIPNNIDFSLIINLLKMKIKLRQQNICIAIKHK